MSRKRVRILPAGRAEALTGKAYSPQRAKPTRATSGVELDLKGKLEISIFCPGCGSEVRLKKVSSDTFWGKCQACRTEVKRMQFTPRVFSVVVKG